MPNEILFALVVFVQSLLFALYSMFDLYYLFHLTCVRPARILCLEFELNTEGVQPWPYAARHHQYEGELLDSHVFGVLV